MAKNGMPKEEWLINFFNKHELTYGVELGVQKGINFKALIEGKLVFSLGSG